MNFRSGWIPVHHQDAAGWRGSADSGHSTSSLAARRFTYELSRSLLPAAGKFRIMQPGRDAGEDRSMAREGYFILDSDLHLMEPHDLWERYLEGAHKANPPHFFAAHRRPEEEIKVVGKIGRAHV